MANNARSAARMRLEGRKENPTGGAGNTARTLNLPEGAQFLSVKSADPRRFDILSYEVTEKHAPYAKVGDQYWERTYYRHAGLGPTGDGMAVCLKQTFGERCPVCEYLATLSRDSEADKAIWKALRGKERQIFNVYDVADAEKGCQIWDVSNYLFGKKLDGELANADDDDNVDDFSSLSENGKTLKINFEEKSIGAGSHPYYEVMSINFKNRTVDHSKTVTHNLDKIIGHPSYDEVKAIMEGGKAPDASEEDEGTSTAPAAQKPVEKAPVSEKDVAEAEAAFACPGGGKFGVNCDEYGAVCNACPSWSACDDEKNK